MDQERFSILEQRQFGLTTLFVVTTLVAIQLGLIRLFGLVMIPIAVQSTATIVILIHTRGHTANGATTGFAIAFFVALLLARGVTSLSEVVAFTLVLATLGSWIGAAIHGIIVDYPICVLALLTAFVWAAAAIGVMDLVA